MKRHWIQEYRCGCSDDKPRKKDLLGYCATHGADARATYRADRAMEHFVNRMIEAGAIAPHGDDAHEAEQEAQTHYP